MELMSVNWSVNFANCVCISLMRMPGTLVEMGLYGPRIVSGALGFISHVSTWLGPPHSNTKMHDFSAATALPPVSSLSLPITIPGMPSESAPMPPAMRACRRFSSRVFMDMPDCVRFARYAIAMGQMFNFVPGLVQSESP